MSSFVAEEFAGVSPSETANRSLRVSQWLATTSQVFTHDQDMPSFDMTVCGDYAMRTVDHENRKERGNSLDALHPMPLVPSRFFRRRSRAVSALRRIEFLEVSGCVRRMDKIYYSVDVYYRDTQSRIPVHGQFGRGARLQLSLEDRKRCNLKPAIQLELHYGEFLKLRHEAYHLARSSHILDNCAFCHAMVHINASSDVKPRWNTHWFKTDEEVCEMLTTYLTGLLKLAAQVPISGPEHCDGQERIPRLLHLFLRTSERDHERCSM